MLNVSLIVKVINNVKDNVPEIMHFVLKPVHATQNAMADVRVPMITNIASLASRVIKRSMTFAVI